MIEESPWWFALCLLQIGQEDILLPGQAHVGTKLCDRLAQTSPHTQSWRVFNTPVFHMQPKEPTTITLTVPSQVILDIVEDDGARIVQCMA